jgi:integrase
MPRKAAPWYRASRSMWFITHRGQQIPLEVTDPNDKAAANLAAQKYLHQTDGPPLAEAVAQFLARIKHRVKPETARSYGWFLSRLIAHSGQDTPLNSLTPHQIERSAVRSTWSDSTRHDYLGAVGTFLRDCGHPLKLRRPPQTSRGVDAVWTEQEFWQVYGASNGDLKPLLLVLRDTGARPAEVAGLTVEGVDWGNACAVLKVHKNARKGKKRILFFAGSALAALEEQKRQYGDGHLFRTETDRPFKSNTLHVRVKRTRERAGIARGLTLYGLRHWYACRALEKGISAEQTAALMGNSPQMILRHYSHIGDNANFLRGIAEKVAG